MPQTPSTEIVVPFVFTSSGGVAATSNYADIIRQHIVAIISTYKGERVMRPTYGAQLLDELFQPLEEVQAAQIEADLREAIDAEEPAANVVRIVVEEGEDAGSSGFRVTVHYSVRPLDDSVFEASALFDPTLAEEFI